MEVEIQRCPCQGEIEHDSYPMAEYKFGSDITKVLPMICPDSDLDMDGLEQLYPKLIEIGQHADSAMYTSYYQGVILRIEKDLYLYRFGDVDDSDEYFYLIGSFEDALISLLGKCTYEGSLPWEEIIIASGLGYLDALNEWEDLVPSEIFATNDHESGSFITVSSFKDDAEVRDFINRSETQDIRAQSKEWQLKLESWVNAQDEKKQNSNVSHIIPMKPLVKFVFPNFIYFLHHKIKNGLVNRKEEWGFYVRDLA